MLYLGELDDLCRYELQLMHSALLVACSPLPVRYEEQCRCETQPPPTPIAPHAAIDAVPTGRLSCAWRACAGKTVP